jgi:hypothetical protein
MAANGGVTHKQHRAILALLQSRSVPEAAEQAGVGTRTLERWLAEDAAFVREFRSTRTKVVEAGIASLQASVTDAVECLRRNLHDPAPPSTQVRSAVSILEHAIRAVETFDIVERLDVLESRQESSSNGHYR